MIYTVTLNTSLDYVLHVDNLEIGKIHKTNEYNLYPGGKGINVSQVLKNLGVESKALGFVAGYTGECLEKMLEDKGITTEFVHLADGITRVNTKIRSTQKSDKLYETDINGAGPKVSDEEKDKLLAQIKLMEMNDILVISGSVPKAVTVEDYSKIIRTAKEQGVKVVADVTGDYLRAALENGVFLIKPNVEEATDFLDRPIKSVDDAVLASKAFKKLGAENVIISLGELGAVMQTNDDICSMTSPSIKVVNTVGAGDSMLAGFVAAYANGESMQDALRLGICAGSATAAAEGLAGYEEIKRLMDK